MAKRNEQINSVLNWVGGKRLLRKKILPVIQGDIDCYVEPFGGAAWILFAKARWARVEVYNDLDSRLVNFFKVVKYHFDALQGEYSMLISSRSLFKEFLDQKGLTDIQRAARFLYLIKNSFGGKGRDFGITKSSGGGAVTSTAGTMALAEKVSRRLDKVIIECLDFQEIFNRYDAEKTFFYCDPPYFKGARYYQGPEFKHERLAEVLRQTKGRWMLSIDDCEASRKMFGGWKFSEVSRNTGINKRKIKNPMFKELLIRNY